KQITVDPKLFDGYIGQYQLAPNFILTITRDGARLFAQATGQGKFEIFPEGEREYFAKIAELQITFETDGQGRATSLILRQSGASLLAKRIEYALLWPKLERWRSFQFQRDHHLAISQVEIRTRERRRRPRRMRQHSSFRHHLHPLRRQLRQRQIA